MNNALGFQPLYKQVYELLLQRISDGNWKPSESLPSEHALAAELGVSQGTVRKALIELETNKLVERRQGKGTFVTEHTSETSNFSFFRLTKLDGTRLSPTGKLESINLRPAKRQEQLMLHLTEYQQVFELRRVRLIDDSPCSAEAIIVPQTLFPTLDKQESLTVSLYPLYQREFGIHVISAEEQLCAETANKQNAKRLNVAVGSPLLRVDRLALNIQGEPVELRSSLLDTSNLSYSVNLS
ncbi:MAG: GntR family transcriptional regulator [Oceanicoccus sp.]|jgi:GntR family transcriptional regulator